MCCSCNTLAWMTLKHDCSTISLQSNQNQIEKMCREDFLTLSAICFGFQAWPSTLRVCYCRCPWALLAGNASICFSVETVSPFRLAQCQAGMSAAALSKVFPVCGALASDLGGVPESKAGHQWAHGHPWTRDFEMPISTKHCGIGGFSENWSSDPMLTIYVISSVE